MCKNKKRICIIRHNYYPQENHVRRDAETLSEAGYEVDIICLKYKNQPFFEIINGIKVYRIPVAHKRSGFFRYIFEYGSFFILASIFVSILYFRKGYKVIEVDTMPDFLVFSTFIPKIFGTKVIAYMFENMPELYTFENMLSITHPVVKFLKIIENLSLKFADKIIVTHALACKIFMKHGIPESKFSIVLNVPNENIFVLSSHKKEKKNKNTFMVVSHGSILKRYGFQVIVKAIKLLEKDISELKLLVVGEGEYKNKIIQLVNNLHIPEKAHFTGFIPFENIPKTIGNADIGIVPMLADLMLPNKLFEYIILNIPTIKDYFDESCVMYFEPGNPEDLAEKILYLYNHPDKRKELVKNASEIYEKYKWSRMKEVYLDVYKKLLKTT